MSALGDLEAVATGGIWKIAALAVLALAFIGGIGMGACWWLAAHDRDKAQAELKAERGISEQLRGSIREQNRATEVLAAAKTSADAHGAAAQQLAMANGKRFDGALARIAHAKAATCADAMPAVNQLLEAIR